MSGANPHRGEVALKIGEREVVLRPSFAALVAIERETGMGLIMLVGKIRTGSIEHVPTIIREGAKAAGHEVRREDIEVHIVDAGIMSVLEPSLLFLAHAISGGVEKKSEPSPATETETATAA